MPDVVRHFGNCKVVYVGKAGAADGVGEFEEVAVVDHLHSANREEVVGDRSPRCRVFVKSTTQVSKTRP